MRPWIKLLIVGLAGFGGGFASGFFVHKRINDIQFQEVTEEEMNEIEKKELNARKQEIPSPSEKKDKVEELKEKDLPADPDELRRTLQGKTPYIFADAEQKKSYEKMWNAVKDYSTEDNANNIPTIPEDEEDPSEDEGDDEEVDDDILDLEREADDAERYNIPSPYQISLGDFYNDRPDFDKITIEWFEPDNTWIDEREEVIPDISTYVGTDVKSLFQNPGFDDDPDIRFIRNERYQTDYEAIRHHKSFMEATGGVD